VRAVNGVRNHAPTRPTMRPRFEPDVAAGVSASHSAELIDPEAYDASEQQFAASLEKSQQPRFVVEEQIQTASSTGENGQSKDASLECRASSTVGSQNRALSGEQGTNDSSIQADVQEGQDPDRWRQEVATRLNNYRARRRPRAPRYPSLRLKFEADEVTGSTAATRVEPAGSVIATRRAAAVESARRAHSSFQPRLNAETAAQDIELKFVESKIIEFPRSSAAPVRVDDLAEPVFDCPRILEAPELVPPPPALGGILIESAEELPSEKRPGFEMPLWSAPMSRRLAAVAIDGAVVLSSVALFAYIFLSISKQIVPLPTAGATLLVLIGLFWVAYQYLLLVYSGLTPGLKLTGLRLCGFDGETASRRVRRWRVLASVLSGVSLGLGYAWCFLDEDQLCWHDRITHTYMAPKAR
jgi:uncharacterized RDD family membrane protein YckC